jgi:glucokinase
MSSSSIIGVDLGGTKTALARFDAETWEEQDCIRRETHADKKLEHVLNDLLVEIKKLRTKDTIAIGMGVPGLVELSTGVVLKMPNISGSENFPLKSWLEEKLGLPVFVDNDANCFALAEALRGAGKRHSAVVGITMGTGVGGGIVTYGKIFHGAHGYAAEVGHMLLKPGEPPYETADARGDVEQFFSGTAMGKRCKEAKRPEEYLEGEVCGFLQPIIFREIAWMCVNLVHLIDPSIIIFGGSAGRALASHLPEVEAELTAWLLPGTPVPELATAELKNAATMGAGLLTQWA